MMIILIVSIVNGLAQNPVITQPYPVNSLNNVSTTITVTNTFQSLWIADLSPTGRSSCAIQNKGTADPMYVYFGAIAGATIARSVKLVTNAVLNCSVFGIVLKDQVSITGTSGDAFYAAQQ